MSRVPGVGCRASGVGIGRAVLFGLALGVVQPLVAQPPATHPGFQIDDGPSLLAGIADYTFNFDDPGFYWLIRRIRLHDDPGLFAAKPGDAPTPWTFLLERPSEYRGRMVVVEGIVESSLPVEIGGAGREDIGRVIQTELSGGGARALCTIISVADAEPARMRERVRAKGYFLKARQYRTTRGEVAAAPVIVAHRLEVLPRVTAAAERRRGLFSAENVLIVATAVLAVVWLFLRRATTRPRPGAR